MSVKGFTVLLVCLVVVSIEAAYFEQSREEDEEHAGLLAEPEMSHIDSCNCLEQCHECCKGNFRREFDGAREDLDLREAAIDNMCQCFRDVNTRERCPEGNIHNDKLDDDEHDHNHSHDDEDHDHNHSHDDEDHDHDHDDEDHDHDHDDEDHDHDHDDEDHDHDHDDEDHDHDHDDEDHDHDHSQDDD